MTNSQTKESKNLPFEEILHATRLWIEDVKQYNKLAGVDSCHICGMNPEVLEQLLDGYDLLISEEKIKELEVLERLNLEFEVVRCDCGEPYKDTDPHQIVKDRIKELKESK